MSEPSVVFKEGVYVIVEYGGLGGSQGYKKAAPVPANIAGRVGSRNYSWDSSGEDNVVL
jgi:hypothetical protein